MLQVLDVPDGLFQELTDVLVVQVVEDLPALTPTDDKPQVAQDAKLMGDGRGFHPDRYREFVDWGRPEMEPSENAQPARGRQRLHRLGDRPGEFRVKL